MPDVFRKNIYSWANNTIKCSLLSFGLFFLNYSRSHISLEVGIQFIASKFEIKNEFYKLQGMYTAYAVLIFIHQRDTDMIHQNFAY